MDRNVKLEARMRAVPWTAGELAEEMNDCLLALTGRRGKLTDRTIRRLLSGESRFPQKRQLLALEAVFDCPAEELGFTTQYRGSGKETGEEADPVQRRSFLASATAALPAATPYRVGSADVAHMRKQLEALSEDDDVSGGTEALENKALDRAQRALELLQQRSARACVKQQLYAVAAEATNHAAFAAIDARHFNRAERHLERALRLAGLSRDSVTTLATWDNIAIFSSQQRRYTDALAASRRARTTAIARRDPLFASLCHARGATARAGLGDTNGARRALDQARTALESAQQLPRPRWMAFYDSAELSGLTAIAHLRMDQPDVAEAHAHTTLARLRPDLVRNRAYYTGQLALAQLRQDELELACATADQLLTHQLPGSARVRRLLQTFRTEAAATGSARARSWLDSTPKL